MHESFSNSANDQFLKVFTWFDLISELGIYALKSSLNSSTSPCVRSFINLKCSHSLHFYRAGFGIYCNRDYMFECSESGIPVFMSHVLLRLLYLSIFSKVIFLPLDSHIIFCVFCWPFFPGCTFITQGYKQLV